MDLPARAPKPSPIRSTRSSPVATQPMESDGAAQHHRHPRQCRQSRQGNRQGESTSPLARHEKDERRQEKEAQDAGVVEQRQAGSQDCEEQEPSSATLDPPRAADPEEGIDESEDGVRSRLGAEVEQGQPGRQPAAGRTALSRSLTGLAFHTTHGMHAKASTDGSRTIRVPSIEPSCQPTSTKKKWQSR